MFVGVAQSRGDEKSDGEAIAGRARTAETG